MDKEPIGIVILNYKTWEKTVSCVDSIFQTYPDRKQIVIVDNVSPNDSFEQLSAIYASEEYKCVTVLVTDRNGGFSYGNNYGFDYVCNHFSAISKVVITNNDILFKEGAIAKLINAFSYSDKVVMTAPSVYNTSGEKTNVPWRKKPTVLQELELKDRKACAYKWHELTTYMPVYMVCGCCFAVDRDLFSSVGRFDDKVFLYNEENIFSLKFNNSGLQIIYCPDADIVHDHGSTTGNRSVFVDKEFVKSTLYFMKTYERLSCLQILCIRYFYICRILVKKIFGRYDNSNNLFKSILEIIKYKV